ncbi:UNVERIFIED_CONTAM: hypothetical protein Sradi_5550400 [Sesamum radiatum]|uniref:Uncharacterized protein n=1 Tax=Sesamum radiatum TaxID=300843 RepID=A0AAW2LDP3_SESRA
MAPSQPMYSSHLGPYWLKETHVNKKGLTDKNDSSQAWDVPRQRRLLLEHIHLRLRRIYPPPNQLPRGFRE